MDQATAARRRDVGLTRLNDQQAQWDLRQRYLEGKHELPYAPEGVSVEYLELRKQAIANWLGIAMGAPVQRCRPEGFRTGRDKEADQAAWNEIWQPNKLDARQPIVFLQSMAHGRGIMSVSANPAQRKHPKIRVESSRRVWLEPDPEDPFEVEYAVKRILVEAPGAAQLWMPRGTSMFPSTGSREVVYVYDATSWVRWERGQGAFGGGWDITGQGEHNLGEVPFVPFDVNVDSDGVPHSALEPLMPAQDALNTIRFNALLAMQFSAFRQRVFSGYDPVIRDQQGQPVWRKNPDGSNQVDPASGDFIPMLRSPGRMGVDRALVFPGDATKVYDLPESRLDNYIVVLDSFLAQMFAVGQIPPQYLLTKMANLSGDALAGAESTLTSLVGELKRGWGESTEVVMRLANRARGDDFEDVASEIVWSEQEARSFAATIDAIVKLTTAGFPEEGAFEMIPGATPPKVKRWLEMRDAQQARVQRAVLAQVQRGVPGDVEQDELDGDAA